MSRYITKDASEAGDLTLKKGDRQHIELAFEPVVGEELKKLLNVDEIPDGYVAGWASTPDLDLYRHKVVGGAFSASITERGLTGPRAIKMLLDHDWSKPAGAIRVLQYRRRSDGEEALWMEAQLALTIGYVRDRWEALKMIGGHNFSVGFFLQDYEILEDAQKVEYLQINRGDLFEISIVAFPGNEDAEMTFVKDGPDTAPVPATLAEFERALISQGLAKSRNEAKAITTLVKKCNTLFAKASEAPPPPASMLDVSKLNELRDCIAKMRSVLAPAAS